MTEWKYCPQCAKPLERKKHQTGETFPTCPDGHFTFYDNPSVTAGAIIERDGKFLVLRRNIEPNKGKWEIPGGFVNAGEGAEDALRREIEEETRLRITDLRYIGSFPSVYGNTGIKTVSVAYHAKTGGGTDDGALKLSDEIKEPRWVGLDGFPKMAHADDQQAVDAFVRMQKERGNR